MKQISKETEQMHCRFLLLES
jgi:hypothetical protein